MAATITLEIDDPGAGAAPAPAPAPSGAPAPAPPPVASSVVAFDRPIPVVIMGPVPIRVTIDGGKAPGGVPAPKAKTPKPPWAARAARVVGQTAEVAGQTASTLAQNRGVASFSAAAGGASRALMALGPAGIVAGAALGASALAVKAFTETVGAFTARGRELAAFNGQLAYASAAADVSRFRSDKRDADVLGPQLAKLIENQAKAEATFAAIARPIQEFLLGKLNTTLELGLKGILALVENADKVAIAFPILVPLILARGDEIAKVGREIRDILAGGGKIDVLGDWLKALRDFKGPPAPGPVPALGVVRPPER